MSKDSFKHLSVLARNKFNSLKNTSTTLLDNSIQKLSQLKVEAVPTALLGLVVASIFADLTVIPLTNGLMVMAREGTSVIPAGTSEQLWAIGHLAVLDIINIGVTSIITTSSLSQLKN